MFETTKDEINNMDKEINKMVYVFLINERDRLITDMYVSSDFIEIANLKDRIRDIETKIDKCILKF